MSDIPSLRSIWPIVESFDSTFMFLKSNGVFWLPGSCSSCGRSMSIRGRMARCTSTGCRKAVSILTNSVFSNSRIPMNDALLLGYLWLSGATYSVALILTTHSPNTIVDYYGYFRQLVGDALDTTDNTVGGPVLEIELLTTDVIPGVTL